MVGITQNRSVQDEKLIEAIFHSHVSPDSRALNNPVYGATTTNLIIDARPTTNAMANTAKGAGTENMDHYKDGKKAYLGIDNIHIMRESLAKVVEALREADTMLASINSDLSGQLLTLAVLDRQALRRSGWLRHISAILEGTVLIAKNVHVNSSHVLIHCSDGWDRTSQLSALSQLCLDPFYRTIRGFEILLEKDWLSFGHKFLDRSGHLSSDKFFQSPSDAANTGSGADTAQAFLASVQNRFVSQHHLKETSPVFHQFLESVRQVQRQFPERFEFNERFLHQIYHHLYSCQFGTFLYNSERERRVGNGGAPPLCERTVSVWDFLNSPEEIDQNRNPEYDPLLDDPKSRVSRADMGVLFPNPKDVRFWHELYGRTDEEMNGRVVTAQNRGVEVVGHIESVEDDPELRGSDELVALKSPPSPSQPPRPLSARPESSAVAFASLAGNSNDLSVSTPEVSTRVVPARANSNALFDTSPSLDILRSARTPSPNPQSPNRTRTKPPDFLSSTAVRSVWGKFSSNASAAFSVVQDAATIMAKDLKYVAQGNNDGETSKTAELRNRETLSAWGEGSPPSVSRGLESLSLTGTATNNPWALSTSPPRSDLEHNPWGPSSSSATRGELYESTSTSLPMDPTVAHPAPLRAGSNSYIRTRTRSPPTRNNRNDSIPPEPPTNTGQTSWTTDPLGVGEP